MQYPLSLPFQRSIMKMGYRLRFIQRGLHSGATMTIRSSYKMNVDLVLIRHFGIYLH